jgi:glycosyltransferase involved in cell wall biosynthesis
MAPRVSVCVCAFNGARVLARAVDSILGQTYAEFELIIVDDASADETPLVAGAYRDERIRVVRNGQNLGNARNRSLAIRLARFDLIKFVDQDDWLEPTCLEEHVRSMEGNPTAGLTFSRCAIALQDPGPDDAAAWAEWAEQARSWTAELRELNPGGGLLDQMVDDRLRLNWIGPPTSVMLRKTCLRRSLLFNRRLRQQLDLDLWMRLMAFSDVGYLDQPLATISVGRGNDTAFVRGARHDWLDRLWLFEGLAELPELWDRYPQLAAMRSAERKSVLVSLLTGRFRTTRLPDALADIEVYAAYKLRGASRRAPILDRL